MRDALYLSKTLGLISRSGADNNEVKRLIREYQEEMLSRGGNAVRLSRSEWTKVSQEQRSSWGSHRSIIPPREVILSDIPWAN